MVVVLKGENINSIYRRGLEATQLNWCMNFKEMWDSVSICFKQVTKVVLGEYG